MIATFAACLFGLVAGARTFTAPAVLAWAARSGALELQGTPLEWLGGNWAPWLFTLLALAELAGDKSPRAPSRKTLPAATARVLSGAFCGWAVALSMGGAWPLPVLAGAVAAVLGTRGGYRMRMGLATRIGKDWPAALLEDVVALTLALGAVALLAGGQD
ncbi:DUF4126 family protein [Marilutibacter aestuarii]|uniref:DUF4126 family protein n=1 Tax=Marilutibacter aestuarii TaxID=1706195 RepID=A0A508ACP2_9GAMM|nr:DUF4126 family protein [Lysobacter aestuarii]TQD47626.1 DUF4126 family protein [Lysobacter aestuarii]